MKLIPSFFRFFSKNLPLFRWGIVILFVVSCVLLFWFFPKPEYLADGRSRFEHYTHIDKFITIFQIANVHDLQSRILAFFLFFWLTSSLFKRSSSLAVGTFSSDFSLFLRRFR